ncbi:hypothetical protein [Actinomycetospora sp. CA-053990]
MTGTADRTDVHAPCAGVAAGTAFLSGPGPVVDFGPGAVARIPRTSPR